MNTLTNNFSLRARLSKRSRAQKDIPLWVGRSLRAQYVLNGTIPLFTLPQFWAHRNPSNGSKNPRRTQDTWVCQRSLPPDDTESGRLPRPSQVPLSSQAAPSTSASSPL